MKKARNTLCATSFALLASVAAQPSAATELVYYPLNPSFGGNPLNGPVLLNSAEAQNKHKDPDAAGAGGLDNLDRTPLQEFNEMLERSILSRLTASAVSSIVDPDSGQLRPGVVETGNFTIGIVDLGGGLLRITTTDKTTGASTQFEVSSL